MIVFLSHSTRDKDFAQKLDAGLTAEGFGTWLCEMDIAPGSNWVGEIERGLRAADLVLLLWSPAAAASAATTTEWMAAWDREITDRRLRLGVVMVKQHELPELLRTKQYIDATGNEERAIGRVVQWLHDRRAAGRTAGKEAPVYLPDYRPQNFVGRQVHLKKMRGSLAETEGMLLLNGEPGSGKSTLALVFAWEAQKDFDAVVFQLCGQRSAEVIAGAMAEQLKGALGEGVTQLPPEKKLQECKDWMKQRRTLLVLDDVWLDSAGLSPAGLRGLLPGPPVSVLFTSRWRNLPGVLPGQTVTVQSFTEPEAEAVFTGYLGQETVARHREALIEFARRVEMLPIAVTVGAELLRSQFGPLGDAARSLALQKLRDEVHDVPGLFQRAIEAQGEDEGRLLQAASVCSPDGFWLPLPAEAAGLSQESAAIARDHLVNASLLRVLDQERRRFQLHALLREQVRASAPALSAVQEAHVTALERLFENWETRWRECSESLAEIIPAAAFLRDSGEANRASQLAYWGFACGKRIGEPDVALRILRKEEEFWKGTETPEAKDALQRSYGNQALILQAWGQLEEALDLHKKKEAICLDLGNKNSLQRSYGNQATILYAWGRLEEALALLKKQEAICLDLGNKDSLQRSYGNQALILRSRGQLEEALALHEKEEAICLELGNKDSLQISYGNQALIFQDWERLDKALALHKKQEAICLELGNRSSLGYCYWYWGVLAYAMGDPAAGNNKLQAALAIFTELNMPRERDSVQQALAKLKKD